jgi:lysophospholipase L1-like esterase
VIAVTAWVLLAFGVGVAARAWGPIDDPGTEAAAGEGPIARPGGTTTTTADAEAVADRVAPSDAPGSRTTGDGPTTTTTAPVRLPDRVLVVGDSLTVGAEDGFVFRLGAGGYDVEVDGEVGRATIAGARALEDLEPTADDLVVVALGTNDPASPTQFAAAIERVLEAAGDATVLWIDIDRPGYERMNAALEQAGAFGRFTIVRWTTTIGAHEELRSGDHVHLSQAGYDLRSQVVAEAVVCAVEGCDVLVSPVVDTSTFPAEPVFPRVDTTADAVTPAGASAAR